MIRDYIRYRSMGINALQAIKMAWPRVSAVEKLISASIVVAVIAAAIYCAYVSCEAHYNEVIMSAHYAKFERDMERSKVSKLEQVLVGCLNREPIAVNGRSMDCRISEHKEAVDL